MNEASNSELSTVEALLKSRFVKEEGTKQRIQSNALDPTRSTRVDQLVLADEERGRMPLTKSKYIIKENPDLVAWEEEVRKFLVNLTPRHEHRVSAVMIYEWATGIPVSELMAAGGSTADLKRLNRILRFYFDTPYMTYICGRKVRNAFKVPAGFYITRRRPLTMTLWAEYSEGTRGHRECP